MAAIPWGTTLAAIDAELATATGPDLAIGQRIRDRLNALGTLYDSVFTPEVDALKVRSQNETAAAVAAYNTVAEQAFDQAYAACLYVENLILGEYRQAITTAFGKGPPGTVTCFQDLAGYDRFGNPIYREVRNMYDDPSVGDFTAFDSVPRLYPCRTSVRHLERVLSEQMDRANDWIALVQVL